MKYAAPIAIGLLMFSSLPIMLSAAAKPKNAAKSATVSVNAPCDSCHGANGEGMAAAHVPRIAGQSAEYLKKQLDDYASGARENPIMANFAKALSEAQREEFAKRYAAMSGPYLRELVPTPQELARGHQLAYQGDESRRVQSCNGCHGPDGSGVAHAAPYIAGQSAEYIGSALKAFQTGTRKNDAGEQMRSVAMRLEDADIVAVSAYFSNQKLSNPSKEHP